MTRDMRQVVLRLKVLIIVYLSERRITTGVDIVMG